DDGVADAVRAGGPRVSDTRMPGDPAGGKVWIDGSLVDADAARVPVLDRGFLYGDSVYEVMRTYGGRPFALDEHLDRLEGSAARLLMAIPDRARITAAIDETARAVRQAPREPDAGELYLRVVVTRG